MATARTAKNAASNMQLPPEVLEGIYTTMRRIRRFDEYTHQLFEEGLVKGTAHSYVGRKRLPPPSAPTSAKMISWPAITAVTATASPKAPTFR